MKKFIVYSFFGIFLAALLGMSILFLAPNLTNRYLSPLLINKFVGDNSKLSLHWISPYKTVLEYNLYHSKSPVISIPQAQILYTPSSIIKGTAKEVLINRGSIHLKLKNGQLYFPGYEPDTPPPTTRKDDRLLPFLPFMADIINLRQCTLLLELEDNKIVTIEINAKITPDTKLVKPYSIELKGLQLDFVTSGDLPATGELGLNLEGDAYILNIENLEIKDSQILAAFTPETNDTITGSAQVTGSVQYNKTKNTMEHMAIDLRLKNYLYKSHNYDIAMDADTVTNISLNGSLKKLNYKLTNLALSRPAKIKAATQGTLQLDDSTVVKGSLNTLFTTNKWAISPLTIETQYDILAKSVAYWSAQIDVSQKTPFQINDPTQRNKVTINSSTLSLAAKKNGKKSSFKADLKSNKTTSVFAGQPVNISSWQLKYKETLSNELKKGTIELTAGPISLHDHSIETKKITLKFPFSSRKADPFSIPTGSGTFEVEPVSYEGTEYFTLAGQININEESATISGIFKTPLQDDIRVDLMAITNFSDMEFSYTLPETKIVTDQLYPYLPIPDDLSLEGTIQSKGEFVYKDQLFHGSSSIKGDNISINLAEQDISMQGLNFELFLPNLPQILSSPSQSLYIDTLEIGALTFSKAKIKFRIEDEDNLFIEKSKLNWCDGKVESGSLRLSRNSSDIDTTLYCDRLNFAQLLAQFGIEDTDGNGSLNGRLPINFSKDGIVFEDGFLFSTPGESGVMRFGNTKMLSAGMGNLEQTATLGYSLEALENFSYDWSRLTFSSNKDILTLSMEISGKPEKPLPYGYKKGQIVHDTKGSGLQHPIRLDLNFNLPQEDIFRYGKNIKSIKEKF